jgi:4-hydroxy-tetrahydrodipicolinate synthase
MLAGFYMKKIYGIAPPMTTPFTEADEVDLEALKADVDYLISDAKVHGLAVGGSTGEGHTLNTEELRTSVGAAVDAARGRVPVIAGIIVDSTRQAIERAEAVADLGVDALQVTPVHYLFRPSDEALYKHFKTIGESVGIPVLIYNVIPWCYLSPSLLTKIVTEVDGVMGVKQSAGDMKLLADLITMLDDRGVIMTAVDALLYPSFSLGAHGAIAAILQAIPALCVELWDAVNGGDHTRARELHETMLPIWNAISADNLPANTKYAMELQGRPAGLPRPPMPESSSEQRKAIKEALKGAGLI